MYRKCHFIPVNERDLTPVLVPSVKSRSLETIVSNYLRTGDTSGLESISEDSFDFKDESSIDFDAELPQSMNKIDAVLHYRNIRDSLRRPLQAKSDNDASSVVADATTEAASDSNSSSPEGA